MPRRNTRRGRPQAVKRIRLQVIRRPEEQIDQRRLSLALIALERGIREDATAAKTEEGSR